MTRAILEIFTSEQKVDAMLTSPIISFIFMILFMLFMLAVIVHLILFIKLNKIRNYLTETNRMDIEPLRSFQKQFNEHGKSELNHIETFVQEKFSNWRLLQIPVVNLIKLVQMTVSVFILIGVLGTFIGLTISLGSINSTGDQLVENVTSVLSGIDVAFYTSIIGMSFSLIMTVLVKVINNEYILTDLMLKVESHLAQNDEHPGMDSLIDVSHAINESIIDLKETNQHSLKEIVSAFAGFKDYTAGLQQSAKDLAAFNDGLTNNLSEFQELFQQMTVVTNGFSEGTTKLNANFDSLFRYFKNSEQKNERMMTAFENTNEKVQEVSKVQIDTLFKFEESIDDLKSFTSSLLEEQTLIQDQLGEIIKTSDKLVETMGIHNNELKRTFGVSIGEALREISSYLDKLSNGFNILGQSITKLPDALDVINQTQSEYKGLLSDRFRELQAFNQTFSNHLKAHSSESVAFEKRMHEAVDSYEQMGRTNNQFVQEIKSILDQMDQSLNRREHQLVDNVDILKETLAKYVTHVERTLGNKLEQIVQHIGHSMNQTSDGIQREFSEIRRITSDTHQIQTQATQQLMRDVGRELHLLNRNLTTVSEQPVPLNSQIGWNQNER